MYKIRIKSIDLFVNRYDRNPIVADLQYQVQKLGFRKTGSSGGTVSTITVAVRQDDGTIKDEVVNVGDIVKSVAKNTSDIIKINNVINNISGSIWKEV